MTLTDSKGAQRYTSMCLTMSLLVIIHICNLQTPKEEH